MKFVTFSTIFVSLAGVALSSQMVSRQASCSEADRFGNVQINPTTLSPGDSFTINATFKCSAEKGIFPVFIDYLIEVPAASNNGHEAPILLAHRDFHNTTDGSVPVDSFTGTLPTFSGYFKGAPYQLVMVVTHAIDNGDGTQTLLQGGTEQPITINGGN